MESNVRENLTVPKIPSEPSSRVKHLNNADISSDDHNSRSHSGNMNSAKLVLTEP